MNLRAQNFDEPETPPKKKSIPYLINQDPHWVLKLISAN